MLRNFLVEEVQRAFSAINIGLFGGKLSQPSIIIDTKKKVSIRFVNEILVIGSEFVNIDYHDFSAILLHEMVHIFNFQQDIVDCTANQYHNTKFLNAALGVGLVVQKQKTQGWGLTSTRLPLQYSDDIRIPEKEMIQNRIKTFHGASLDRNIFRQYREKISGKIKKAKPCFLKYVCECPPPHNSIRSGRRPDGEHPLRVTCNDCGKSFICE